MLRVRFRPIRPGKEARLKAWLAELNERADEVRATFKDETVRAEQAFIIDRADGPLLVYAAEAADFAQGAAAFANSQHPIDAEHRQVMRECLDPALDVRPQYDVSARWQASPILTVPRVRQAAEYYRDVLGFSLDPVDGVFQPSPSEPDGIREMVVEDLNGYRLAFGELRQ